jgi:hypothetical protein
MSLVFGECVPTLFCLGGGGDTLAGRRVGGVNILEDESHMIALLQ